MVREKGFLRTEGIDGACSKKGMQACDLSVQVTNSDRGKQEKQENISRNGSLGGPEISPVEACG